MLSPPLGPLHSDREHESERLADDDCFCGHDYAHTPTAAENVHDFFRPPLKYAVTGIAIDHKLSLPRRTIDYVGRVPCIFLGIVWSIFTFVCFHV